MARIVVTGAAGFIGSHLCERLAERGHSVAGVDCFTDYYPRALKELNARDAREKGVEVLRLDLAVDDLRPALDGAEYVFHLAAQPGISANVPFEHYSRNNITATYCLLEALKGSASLRGLFNISTSSVYGAIAAGPETAAPQPTSFYGVTKLAAEQLALSYDRGGMLPVCSMRLFSVYGPRERPEKLYTRLIRCILEDKEFPLCEGSLEHRRSFTYVEDIVDGLLAGLQHFNVCKGEVFNLGSETENTTAEGIKIIERILGRPARKVLTPPRPGDQQRTCANIGKARRLLGYAPRRSLEEGLRNQVEWYRQKVHGRL